MSVSRAEADLARVRSEIHRLRVQLDAAILREQKLANYVEMARVYETDELETTGQPKPQTGSALVHACIEIIKSSGRRQHTRFLVAELAKKGLNVGGANPVTNLSGALSRSEDLISNRLEGWGLKDWPNGTGPNEAGLVDYNEHHALQPMQHIESNADSHSTTSSWDKNMPVSPELDEEIPF
jgi:hypothetical protein